ncbi:MAG: putative metalloprotease CJM1_0395 family protein [Pseudomonadota bacterium]
MLSGIGADIGRVSGGEIGAIYFRPVQEAAPVAPRGADPSREAGVTDEAGRALSAEPQPLESLSRDKRLLLEQLRGELSSREADLLRAGPADFGPSQFGPADAGAAASAVEGVDAGASDPGRFGLSEAEQEQVDKLKERDREVRAHEQAHAAVGGQYAGAPTYEYQVGPDGQRYAVGGQVQIDTAPIPGDPEATLEKLRVVERAALAPAEPSPQDRQVAQQARAAAAEAQAELNQQAAAERRGEAPPQQSGPNQGGVDQGGLAAAAARQVAESGYQRSAAAQAAAQIPTIIARAA